jgi:DNA-binding response OmpR family regulator
MVESNAKILCVDDNADSCEVLTRLLILNGFAVEAVQDTAIAVERAKRENFRLFILDNKLADSSGLDLCRMIRSFDNTTPIVFYSALAYLKDQEAGLQAGAQAYLTKPADWDKLIVTVRSLVTPRYEIPQSTTYQSNPVHNC